MTSVRDFCLSSMPVQDELDSVRETELRQDCQRVFSVYLEKGSFNRREFIALFTRPSLEERRFVFDFFAKCFEENGDKDKAIGLYRKIWRIGGRRYKHFTKLVSFLRIATPDLAVWQFIKESFWAAVAENSRVYVLDVLNFAHEMSMKSYRSRISYVPFQDCISIAAVKHVLDQHRTPMSVVEPLDGRKLRLCYALSSEEGEAYSPVTDIAFSLAEGHDPDKVSVALFSCFDEETVIKSERIRVRVEALRARQIPVIFAKKTQKSSFLSLIDELVSYKFDAVIFPSLTHMIFPVAVMRPGHLLVGLGLGDVDIYTSPLLDFTADICGFPISDALCRSYRVPDFIPEGRQKPSKEVLKKSALGIPDVSHVVVSSGRSIKFFSEIYWQIVVTVLQERPSVNFVVIGATYDEMATFLTPYVSPQLLKRIHFLGWCDNHLETLSVADICLDTFPMAGGFNLVEAMGLGIPTVLCHNKIEDYMNLYTNKMLMPIGDLVESDELCFDWDDVENAAKAVMRLIDDPAFYAQAKQIALDVAQRRSHVEKSVEAVEGLIRENINVLVMKGVS